MRGVMARMPPPPTVATGRGRDGRDTLVTSQSALWDSRKYSRRVGGLAWPVGRCMQSADDAARGAGRAIGFHPASRWIGLWPALLAGLCVAACAGPSPEVQVAAADASQTATADASATGQAAATESAAA